jgi:thioredoxin-like negative regulator of GroEL
MIETITDKNIADLTASPVGVLVLSKSDCGHCHTYADELGARIAAGQFGGVSIGKMILDRPGAGKFKLKNAWVSQLPTLPYTVVFVDGKAIGHFATSKASYLKERLDQLVTKAA